MSIIDTIINYNLRRLIPTRSSPPSPQEFQDMMTAITKANEPLAALLRRSSGNELQGQEWAKTIYGDFYATTVHVYRAVKLRADAVSATRLKVWSANNRSGELEWVGENHAVQQFLDRVNPHWSRVDMWRAVETYLSLWGSCFRWISKPTQDINTWEMWVLRPDKVSIVVDTQAGPNNQYIKGFVFDPHGANFAMLPDEVIWDRYFNPLNEFAGLSPIAPARLVIEMQSSMLSTNRDLFRNGMLTSNLAFLMRGPLNSTQIETFYERLADRHAGKGNAQKPIVVDLGEGDVKNMGFSNKEMEYLEGLQLTKEYMMATYGIPEEMMPGARHATFSNREEARREFNESTIEQEWTLLESAMQERFVPHLPTQFERQDLVLRFDRDEVLALQENVDRRSERHLKEVTAGVRTINEFREPAGLDQIPQGDVLLIPSTAMPVLTSGTLVPTPTPDQEESARVFPLPLPRKELSAGIVNGEVGIEIEVTAIDRSTWDLFIKRFDKATEDFHELMDRLFKEQEKDTIKSLNRLVGALRASEAREAITRAGPDQIFQATKWRERFIEQGLPVMTEILDTSAKAQVVEFGLGISFDVTNASTQTWLDTRAKFWADRVNEETAKLITEEIAAGIADGEGIRKLQGRVEKVFQFNSDFRSELIARTEATSSANQGHQEAYVQAGVPSKRWLATLDGRTRDSHTAAHGQVVEVEQSFSVGGNEMFMPGQGPVEEVVNCRCTTTPVFEETT